MPEVSQSHLERARVIASRLIGDDISKTLENAWGQEIAKGLAEFEAEISAGRRTGFGLPDESRDLPVLAGSRGGGGGMSEQPKFTPGPWALNDALAQSDERFGTVAVESKNDHGFVNDGWVIAVCHGSDQFANARLIAAAPEMYAVLRELMPIVRGEIHKGTGWFADWHLKSIEGALDKASGKEEVEAS